MAAAMTDGGQDYDDALPGAATELAPSAARAAAHTAWALDDSPEWKPPFWTAGRITAAVASAGVLALVVAAAVSGYYLRADPPVAAPTSAPVAITTTSVVPTPESPPPPPVPPTTKTVTVETQAPIDYDERFLENLRARGWNVWDKSVAEHAHTVCAALRGGDTVASVNAQMVTVGLLYEHEAGPFTATAMATYPNCP